MNSTVFRSLGTMGAWAWAALALGAGAGEPGDAARTRWEAPAASRSQDVEAFPPESAAPSDDCAIVVAARRGDPLLALKTGGPINATWALAFAPDSSRFYSAGLDKVVQGWGVQIATRAIIRRQKSERYHLAQELRWEISRGPNGSIYSLAASPASGERRLAIAGYSARAHEWGVGGDIVVYDAAAGEIERVLEGHGEVVISVDFSPNGQRVVSVDKNGEVRIWSAADGWKGRVLKKADGKPTTFQPARFLSDDVVVASVPTTNVPGQWRLALHDLRAANPTPRLLDVPHANGVAAIAKNGASDAWASSDLSGKVYVWSGIEQPTSKLLRDDRIALDLSFAPNGSLFVATDGYDPAKKKKAVDSTLEMWDDAGRALDAVTTAKRNANRACEVSPDGSRVVTTAGDENELFVFSLRDPTGKPYEKPLSTRPPARLRGVGRRMTNVAFADDDKGYRIGYAVDDSRKISEAFDLSNPAVISKDVDKIAWRPWDVSANGWDVKGDAQRVNLYLVENGQRRGSITLNPVTQGSHASHCWITDAAGKPYAVAIGTNSQQGIFVYDLAPQGECSLLRCFRDHNGYVSGLAVSKDAKYLASSSWDQTIKVWSLEGLAGTKGPFPKAAGWGATFERKGNDVVITKIIEAGTATRKGLRLGDRIVWARFASPVAKMLNIPENRLNLGLAGNADVRSFDTTDPDEILRGLEVSPLNEYVGLDVKRGSAKLNERVWLIPAWSPLATLFVDREGEWAFWTPMGYYDASVNGDERFGWQMNRGPAAKPDFYRADQFRMQFERPGVMKGLLAVGSVPQALRQDRHVVARPDTALDAAIRKTPIVTIVSPRDGQQLDGELVNVEARVDYPDAEAAQRAPGQAYINGVPGTVTDDRQVGSRRTFRWRVPVADVYNRARVVALEPSPDRMVSFADVHFQLRPDPTKAPARPKLHIVTLAVGTYKQVTPLAVTLQDASAIAETLQAKTGKFYDLDKEVIELKNENVTRERVNDALAKLRAKLEGPGARPDDLVVVFLAGHGVAVDNQYYFVTANANENNLAQVSIPWTQLQELSKLPCRKLCMLDTCHSGSVLPIRDNPGQVKAGVRPLKQGEILVLSATDVNQEAIEVVGAKHGMFTQCVLDGFDGQADSAGDGDVDLQELASYVQREVPRRTAKFQPQTPRSSPEELFDFLSVPLVSVR